METKIVYLQILEKVLLNLPEIEQILYLKTFNHYGLMYCIENNVYVNMLTLNPPKNFSYEFINKVNILGEMDNQYIVHKINKINEKIVDIIERKDGKSYYELHKIQFDLLVNKYSKIFLKEPKNAMDWTKYIK